MDTELQETLELEQEEARLVEPPKYGMGFTDKEVEEIKRSKKGRPQAKPHPPRRPLVKRMIYLWSRVTVTEWKSQIRGWS